MNNGTQHTDKLIASLAYIALVVGIIGAAIWGLSQLEAPVTQPSSGSIEIYRWQDADGVWHFSEQQSGDSAADIVTITEPMIIKMDKPSAIDNSSDEPAPRRSIVIGEHDGRFPSNSKSRRSSEDELDSTDDEFNSERNNANQEQAKQMKKIQDLVNQFSGKQ